MRSLIPVVATSRAWVWPVLLAVLAGAALLARVLRVALATAPDDVREAYRAAWHRSWRPVTTTGVALAWTLVYALYSLSLPTLGPLREVVGPGRAVLGPAEGRSPDVTIPPPPPLRPTGPTAPVTLAPTDSPPTSGAPTPAAAPDADGPPEPSTCAAAAAGDAVRQVQEAAELLTGRRIGADLSLVIEALAGCGDAESAALSLLGPINQLLDDAGVPLLVLPPTPDLPIPRVPEALAAPLRPVVFEVCAQVTPQLLTVTAVAPIARISTADALRVLQYVTSVCRAFAPEPTS